MTDEEIQRNVSIIKNLVDVLAMQGYTVLSTQTLPPLLYALHKEFIDVPSNRIYAKDIQSNE